MKLNLCTAALAAMVIGVTARPAVDNVKTREIAVPKGRSIVGDLILRRDDDEEEEEEEESSKSSSSSDDDEEEEEEEESSSDDSSSSDDDSDDDSDSSSSTTTSGSGTYNNSPQATKTSSSGSSATGSSGGSSTTGSASSGSSSSGGSLPASSGTSALSAAKTIAAGESFDGGMVMFDRGVSCEGQTEGGDSDAVFQLENGASISNVIIGPNQIEGIHCQGACTLTNVWWSAVCEDAFTVKNQDAGETTTISGGGAYGASDKVLQHNGGGTISVSGFTVDDFGKLYRSCGNCDTQSERHVVISDVTASNGDLLAGINSNYGDTATISGVTTSAVEEICEQFEGNDTGDEPTSVGTGNDGTYCIIS